MPRNILKVRKAPPGPFIIVDANNQPVLDANGKVRVFSTASRAKPHLRPGDSVVVDPR